MATPVSERIVEVVRLRLAQISIDDGFETTVSEVVRPKRLENPSPKDYQLVLSQGDKTENREHSCPGNPPIIAWDFPILIRGILRPSEENDTAIDTLKNTFEADVMKAVNTGNAWWNMSGLAINSRMSPVTDYESDDGAEGGFEITLTVIYRTDENDPYTVRT